MTSLQIRDFEAVPETLPQDCVLRFPPVKSEPNYYRERTDRNIGWITSSEQKILKNSVVGIAGTGGMGGLLASILVRLGVGEVRISDCETFDNSNLNRQFGALKGTVGKSKALETARLVRAVSDDNTLIVYPNGIDEQSVDLFLDRCDVVCDEIEVLAINARILLHQKARIKGVSLFNCNTAGFGTNLFLYTPTSMTMEEAVGYDYDEATRLHQLAMRGDQEAVVRIAESMMEAVVPSLPEYSPDEPEANRDAFYRRFTEERKVPIIATNPPMATGFLADRVLLYLLRDSGVKRDISPTPEMPGYLHFDAATMTAKVVTEGWSPRAR